MEDKQNNEQTESTLENGKETVIPKFNIPSQIDYTKGFDFKPINGGQIFREVITDTYVTAAQNEDEMVKRIDDAMTILYPKRKGFAGYLSFCYLHLTLFYILKNYDECLKVIDNIFHGIDCVEKFIFTGNYEDSEGKDTGFVNYAFGESDAELKNTVRYLHDSWNVAKMIHAKAGSFESGYSLTVSELMLHAYNKQLGMMRKDCEILRDIAERIKSFIINERDNPSDEGIGTTSDTEFASIEDLQKDENDGDKNNA